jgi:hypothetical protein
MDTHCEECLIPFKKGDKVFNTEDLAKWVVCETCFIKHLKEDLIRLGRTAYSLPTMELFRYFFGPDGDKQILLRPLMKAMTELYLESEEV